MHDAALFQAPLRVRHRTYDKYVTTSTVMKFGIFYTRFLRKYRTSSYNKPFPIKFNTTNRYRPI